MSDWSSVSDEAYPFAGVSAADLKRFVASVGQPLTRLTLQISFMDSAIQATMIALSCEHTSTGTPGKRPRMNIMHIFAKDGRGG
jgi:hypothetical protein